MGELILLYWGTVFLMYLSQAYFPVDGHIADSNIGNRHFLRRNSDIFMIIVITWLTCFSFLRTRYNDTTAYISMFQNADSFAEEISKGTLWDWTEDAWSTLYCSLVHDITTNYHIFFFLPAFLTSFAMVKLCKRYSTNPAFSLMIFLALGTYISYMAALKQSIASFFLLAAIPYALDKKYVRFYLLVAIATMFHTFALTFAIIPLLTEKPWGKISWILLGLTLFSMATYESTLGAFMSYAESVGASVSESEVMHEAQISILRALVYWIPAIFALVFRKKLFDDSTQSEHLFINISMVGACFLTIGTAQGANLMGRVAAYFEFASGITLPWMINKLFDKPSARLVTTAATVLYFGYFMYEFAINKDFGNNYSAISMWDFIVSLVP